jgi:hypothetical protein
MLSKLYLVTIEGRGDGSGNYCDYYRPGISFFTSRAKANKAIRDYVHNYDEDIEISVAKCNEIIDKGGVGINEHKWISVKIVEKNPKVLDCENDWREPIKDLRFYKKLSKEEKATVETVISKEDDISED